MCRGEVATFHQVTQSVAFHWGAVILEISSHMEQNAVACQAVNTHPLDFCSVCSFFFLQSCFSKGSWHHLSLLLRKATGANHP